ncbi:MAG: hypothetical protein ABR954_04390 [Dehalococcoidales bacterium]
MQNTPTPNTPQDITPTATPPTPTEKRRHGCLTTWLILIVLGNIAITVVSIEAVTAHPEDYYAWVMPVQIIFLIWGLVCVMALIMWKKWGFYGFLVGAFTTMILYLVTGNYVYAFTPFISVLCLYGVLHIGSDNKGWPQLD